MSLDDYLKAWKLSDPEPLAETGTSYVYIVTFEGARAVLKLLTPIGIQDEGSGAVALRYWAGHGAVKLLREDEQALLLEYADGDDLTGLLRQGETEKATALIADVINQLHTASAEAPPQGLHPLKGWFRALFEKAESDRRAGIDSIYGRGACVAEALLADPREVRVLHGDIHHGNIRHSQRGWLAFDPKGLIGERTYDAANTLCNLIYRDEPAEEEAQLLSNAAILAEKLGIEHARVLAYLFAYICLSASWSLEANEDVRESLSIAEIVEPHLNRL